MKKSLFIFILAATVALSSGLPLQAAGSAMDTVSEAPMDTMSMEACADCADCDENSVMPACDNACLSACTTGISLAVVGHTTFGELLPTALVYRRALWDRLASTLPPKDLPPPRI